MYRLAALLVFAAAAHAELNPESGAFLFHKYSPKDYKASPQNWDAVQDSRGVMYFANTDGILSFDGVTWRTIPVSSGNVVRSLAVDSRGTIFAGGHGTFGYLAPDAQGSSRFVSLLDKVPLTDRAFSDVWDILPTSDGVYFSAHRRLFLYTPSGAIKVFRPTDRFGRAFTYAEELFVTSSDRGLLTVQGKDLIQSIGGNAEWLRRNPSFAAGPVPLLADTHSLYRFSLGSIDPFPTAADKYFQEHEIYCLSQLPTGDIAVGTKTGGLVLLNQKGQIERYLRTSDGMLGEWVVAIHPDRQGGVWVSTDGGLTRFGSSLTSFENSKTLHGNVYALGRVGGVLYVGTSLGLFRLRSSPGDEPAFDQVTGIKEAVLAIVEHAGNAFVGTERGLYVLSGGTARSVLPHLIYDISFSPRDPDILYTAGSDGAQRLKRSGDHWTVLDKESGSGQEFRTIVEAPDGSVWSTSSGSIWHIWFSQTTKAEQFKKADGVPAGFMNAYRFRRHVVFATGRGLLQFDEKTKRFVPDGELGNQFANGTTAVSVVSDDGHGNVWVTGKDYHGIVRGQQWFPQPLLQAGIGELYTIHLDSDGSCWTAGATGTLYRLQGSRRSLNTELTTLLRGVFVTNQENIIFGGEGPPKENLRLPYRDNAMRFEFAAPFFEDDDAVEYQVRLQGTESNWSPWATDSRKDYTNLPERAYTFHVRARNPHGVVSPEVTFHFRMLAPWYRAWWAYAIYAAAFLFAGWLILRWRLRALQDRNKWLEKVVEERTAEVRTERDQNEALLLNILPKPVASELRTTGSVKPTSFDDVTVCFSDFVGFTLSSEKLPAQELISSLNDYFTAFDDIIGRYGLEKLKTIGDAYMFAGGLPNASPSHAVDAVLAALEMVQAVRKLARPEKGVNWSIRLGLYSGPVVAGVVGVRKFAFDIWGNTVNFAARMESAGSANRVNLSETTGARVLDFIDCEPRGPVRIKEGREMEMYFALQPKPELLAGPWVDGIPEAFRIKYEQAFSKPLRAFPNLNGRHD